ISYNKLIDEGVVAIEGPPQSTAELALKPIVGQKKIPDVSVGASDDQVIPVEPYMFQTTPLASQVSKACLKQIQALKFTKLAMLTDTKNAYAIKGHDVTKNLVSQFGITIVDDESFETTQTNFATQIAKIVAAKPDILLVWATGAPPVIITKQWGGAKTGIPLMMTAAEASPLYVNPAEPEVEGVYVQATLGVLGQNVPSSNKFKKLIDDFAQPFQTANGTWPPQFAWDSMLGLTRRFGGVVAVNQVSIRVAGGELHGVIGPNGAGKSTLFHLVTGHLRPTAGEVLFEGRAISRLSAHRRARLGIAIAFQAVRLFRGMSVLENVMVGAHARTGTSFAEAALRVGRCRREEREIRAQAEDALERARLTAVAARAAESLPLGQQRGVQVARA